jgi:hypothetical protein
MKNKKSIVIILMVLTVAVAVYWFIWRKKSPQADVPGNNPDPINAKPGAASPNQGTNPPTAANSDFPLTTGSRGKYVTAIQQLLKDKYKISLTVDGIFGPKTKAALTRAFKMYSVKDLATFNSLFTK